MDTHIIIDTGNIKLEGVLNKNTGSKAVIVTHPHPLYGGNMDNPVVMTIAQVFYVNGFTTLRFNFRGAGNSSGSHDDGQGEQDDVESAISYLMESGLIESGNNQIWLAGYSFGSKINASVVSKGCNIAQHIMVSPPVAFMSFKDIQTLPKTDLVVTGINDEIAPPDQIQTHLHRWGIQPEFKVIESCDHFYSGSLNKLEMILNQHLRE